MYKNIAKREKLQLRDLVEYRPGQIVSQTLVQNDKVSMTLFSFDRGEEISTHAAGGDAFLLSEGETLIKRPRVDGIFYRRHGASF